MRTGLIAAILTLATAFGAQAFEHRTPAARQLHACGPKSVVKVASKVDSAECCVGQLRCTQYLATRSIIKPKLDPRT